MHDPTEGGLATGLHELAEVAGLGATINETAIPLSNEGEAMCRALGLDPLGVITSGALLLAVAPEGRDMFAGRLRKPAPSGSESAPFTRHGTGCSFTERGGPYPCPATTRIKSERYFETASSRIGISGTLTQLDADILGAPDKRGRATPHAARARLTNELRAPSFELGGGSMHIVNSEGKMVQSYGHIRISRARRFFRANSPQKKACAAQPNNGVRCPVKIFLAVYFLSAEHTLKIICHTGKVPANDVHMIKSIIHNSPPVD